MKILDTTIRDGSYAVDFKFSCRDVKRLVSRSARLGIEYIEIGHGQGLNASSAEHGYALQSDIEYMDAAKEAAPNSKLGFFCIPDIARYNDIHTAKEHGMSFIRIGINITNYTSAEAYVKRAKDEGLKVAVNYMKSYVVSPKKFAEAAKFADKCGADCVYIVDSAGCMDTHAIDYYIDAVRETTDIALGFHGHNNLGLAVSNTIHCVHKGIEFIDCSYQGLGRSCGNASLEQVVMTLEKQGYDLDYDIPRTLEYGYSALRNIVDSAKLVNPLDYMCGFAGFHSGYLKDIYKCSNEMSVDPLRLILAYAKKDLVGMDYGLLQETAKELPNDPYENPYSFGEFFSDKYRE